MPVCVWRGGLQACILDLLFLVLSVQYEHYNSELALRLLGRFPEADVEHALKLLREKVVCLHVTKGRATLISKQVEECCAYVFLNLCVPVSRIMCA